MEENGKTEGIIETEILTVDQNIFFVHVIRDFSEKIRGFISRENQICNYICIYITKKT